MPSQTMLSVQQFSTKNAMTPMPHPPYSLDLSLSDIFFVVSWAEKVLKGKHFDDVEEVKQKQQKH